MALWLPSNGQTTALEEILYNIVEYLVGQASFSNMWGHLKVADEGLRVLIGIALAFFDSQSELPAVTKLKVNSGFRSSTELINFVDLVLWNILDVSQHQINDHILISTVLSDHLSWTAIIKKVGADISDQIWQIQLHVFQFPQFLIWLINARKAEGIKEMSSLIVSEIIIHFH